MTATRDHVSDQRSSAEEQLIGRARDGDEAAFRSLYETHHRRIYALALRLAGDAADAEELTQEVFVAAWRALDGYRGIGRFSTWLHGIAVRRSRQRWRGLIRRWRREEDVGGQAYARAVATAMPAAEVEIEQAISRLPERMRAALVLHAIYGYSQAETAGLMGIAEGTVKAHVHRARTLLRNEIEEAG
jgi:RNA polymerase sigma-70 factor (ECF subfamily)